MIDCQGYVSYSDPDVVARLIRERSRIDRYYSEEEASFNPMVSNGTPVVVEDILCIYIDLESLIEACGLSPTESKIVQDLMYGYSISDIAEHYKVARQTCDTMFHRAVDKIVKENDRRWIDVNCDAKASYQTRMTV